jgi:hypothetical protein
MKTHSLLLLYSALTLALQAQDTPQNPPAMPTARLAYFLDHSEEAGITISEVGTLQSVITGRTTGYFPINTGPHTIEIKERFNGKPVFHKTFTVNAADRSLLVICGKPDSKDFPPQLVAIPQPAVRNTADAKQPGNATATVTFFNFDTLGPLTVHTANRQEQLDFQLKPGEQKKVDEIPVDANSFTLDTASVPNQHAPARLSSPPSMMGVGADFLVFIHRPSGDGGAQTFITENGRERIFAREE